MPVSPVLPPAPHEVSEETPGESVGHSPTGGALTRRNLRVIYAAQFLANIHLTAAITVLFFTEWGHLNYTEIFILQAIFWFAIFALEIPGGLIADRLGRKTSVMLGYLVMAISVVLYGSINAFWSFAVAEIIWGFAVTLFSGAFEALVYESLRASGKEAESSKVFATLSGLRGLGFGIGGIIGLQIGLVTAWNVPMILRVIPAMVGFGMYFWVREPPMHRPGADILPPSGPPPGSTATPGALAPSRPGTPDLTTQGTREPTKPETPDPARPSLGDLFKDFFRVARANKKFRRMCVVFIIFNFFGFYAFWVYTPKFQQVGLPVELWGIVVFCAQVGVITLPRVIKRVGTRFAPRWVMATGVFLCGATFLAMAYATSPWTAGISFLLLSLTRFAFSALFLQYLNQEIRPEARATVLSTVNTFVSGSTGVFNLFVGALFDLDLNLVLFLFGACLLLTVPFTFLVEPARVPRRPGRPKNSSGPRDKDAVDASSHENGH